MQRPASAESLQAVEQRWWPEVLVECPRRAEDIVQIRRDRSLAICTVRTQDVALNWPQQPVTYQKKTFLSICLLLQLSPFACDNFSRLWLWWRLVLISRRTWSEAHHNREILVQRSGPGTTPHRKQPYKSSLPGHTSPLSLTCPHSQKLSIILSAISPPIPTRRFTAPTTGRLVSNTRHHDTHTTFL